MESRDILAAAWVTNFASYTGRKRVTNNFPIELADVEPKADFTEEPTTDPTKDSKTVSDVESGDVTSTQPKHATDFATMNRARNKKIQRSLLLNAYPIAYVLLWLPGLINRFVELTTGRTNFALQVLQSSTQFVGVANAITYGFNERVRRRLRDHFSGRNQRSHEQGLKFKF
jgi:hypothetical protein